MQQVKRIDAVRKRDGRVEPYDETKLADSILRAARAAGEDRGGFAHDLAGVVTTYLERHHGARTPESGEIRGMVEKVLRETGRVEVARAYMRQPGIPLPDGELFPADSFLVDGATRDEVSAWARDRISDALVKEAAVDASIAHEIARAVEERILQQKERRVSTSLIRELVNQELLARGYRSKLRKQLVVGLPKYDLERLVQPEEAASDPDRLCRTIGETTMKQYALQELFPVDVADAHLEGRIHIHGLDYPQKHFWTVVDSRPGPGKARALTAELAQCGRVRRRGAQSLEIPRFTLDYADRTGCLEEAPFVPAEVTPCWVGIDVGVERTDSVARAFLHALPHDGVTPEFFVHDAAFERGETLREVCRTVVAHGRALFVLRRALEPTLTRFSSDGAVALAGAVTVNLAQPFYRSERGSDFYAELDVALTTAIRALIAKGQLGRRGRGESASHEYAIAVAGLEEAAQLITGVSPTQGDQALRTAVRILSYVHFRVMEEGQRHGLRLRLHDVGRTEASLRLMRVDTQMFARARGRGAKGEEEYTVGGRFRCVEGGDLFATLAAGARLHTLIPFGAVEVSEIARKGLSADDLFELLRRLRVETQAAQVWFA